MTSPAVMRGVILSGSTFKAPYFVPMILTSYNYAYGGQTTDFSPGFAMMPHSTPPFPRCSTAIRNRYTISEAMGMTFTPPTSDRAEEHPDPAVH